MTWATMIDEKRPRCLLRNTRFAVAVTLIVVFACVWTGCSGKQYPPFETKVQVLESPLNRGLVTYGVDGDRLLFACFAVTTNKASEVPSPLVDVGSGTSRHHCRLDLPGRRTRYFPEKEQYLIEISDEGVVIEKSGITLEQLQMYIRSETNVFRIRRMLAEK